MRKRFIGIALSIALLGTWFSSQTKDSVQQSDSITLESYPMTKQEIEELQRETGAIHTENGIFTRVHEQQDFDRNQNVYDLDDVSSKTRQIILDYGVFVWERDI